MTEKKPIELPPATLADLPERMRTAMARAGWLDIMPVQARTIPYLLAKRDLMVQSRTGSGKTGAFLLPILDRIDPRRNACQALIMAPTRELAKQVEGEARTLAGDSGIRTVAVYGGVGYGPQIDAFRKGAHIVVGTPGRLLDHLLRHTLTLEHLEMLVFDEADRMLSMGFYPDMREVQRYLPSRAINGSMFSATFPPRVMRLANQFLRDPEILSLSTDHVHVTEVEHAFMQVPGMDKDRALARLIEVENPDSALVFCNTKVRVHYVATVLSRFGYDVDELSSDLSQAQRESIMSKTRDGSLRLLVATDVASRGIDLPDLSHVILYEVPEDPEGYIHRAGRTGRAGASGVAISLVSAVEKMELDRIARRYAIDMDERPMPTDEDVELLVAERLLARLEARLRDRDKLIVERMARFIPMARDLGGSDEGLALLAMLLDDAYQPVTDTPAPVREQGESSQDRPKKGRRRRSGKRRDRSSGAD